MTMTAMMMMASGDVKPLNESVIESMDAPPNVEYCCEWENVVKTADVREERRIRKRVSGSP